MSLKSKRVKTVFGKAKSKKLASIVKIDTPANARKSVKELQRMFDKAGTKKEKLRIKRAVTLAATRAEIISDKKTTCSRERIEMRAVMRIYRRASSSMKYLIT